MKILVLLFILLQVSNSFAQKESLSFGLETDLTSSYLWNGISYNDGLINQSSVWVSTNDFTLTTWTNYVLKDFDDRNKTNEIDLILAYEKEFGAITFEPSLLLYTYPKQTNPTTAEFSLLLTYPLENFDVFTSFTSDFLEYKGTFYNTSGVAFEKELSEQTICDLTAKINFANSKFNETNIGVSKAAFNFTGIETGLNYNFSENLYLRLHFEFDYFFDSELRNALPEKYPKNFGLTLGGNF